MVVGVGALLLPLVLLPLRPLLRCVPLLLRVRVCAEVVAVVVVAMIPRPRLRLRRLMGFRLLGVIILNCHVGAPALRARLGRRWMRLTWNLKCCERLGRLRNVLISFVDVCCMHSKSRSVGLFERKMSLRLIRHGHGSYLVCLIACC